LEHLISDLGEISRNSAEGKECTPADRGATSGNDTTMDGVSVNGLTVIAIELKEKTINLSFSSEKIVKCVHA